MARPLYRLPEGVSCEPTADGHHGLWYDKFWSGSWTLKATANGESPKLSWIRKFTQRPVGSGKALADFARRLYELVVTRGGVAMVGTTTSRFVTGLGRSHPVENGFAWHPTLGTPYLPGSSLKGLTRAWAKDAGYTCEQINRLLGEQGEAGRVAFLDAVPVQPVKLEVDVLTPHYANWSESNLPGDWRSPTPVPYLVAAPGLSMLFSVIPLPWSSVEDLSIARECLAGALSEFGAGAKTAIGYGQFSIQSDDPFLQRLERERREREAKATPEGRWRLLVDQLTEEELLNKVQVYLVDSPLEDETERRAFVLAVLETGKVSSWRRGETTDPRTGTGGRKLKERARAVRRAAEELGVELPS